MKTIRPPVKWHGGKYYLAARIVAEFPAHRIFVEPYGGAASVLLNKAPCDVEVYNDIDLKISRLFRVLRSDGDRLLDRLRLTPYSQVEFLDSAEYPDDADDTEKAAIDFTRWRQSFGGQGKSWSCTTTRARGGMAGDVNAWWTAIDGLPQVIDRIKRVQIMNDDALKVIKKFDHPEALIYCDPPYVQSTRTSVDIYSHEMDNNDHLQLSKLLKSVQAKVVLSGYPSDMYRHLYPEWRIATFDIANHASGGSSKKRMQECLWMNF